jgi:nitrogen fixation protein FixH
MSEPAHDSISGGGRRPREVTGRVVFVCLVAFFVAVTGVNAVMIAAAVSTFGGVETESAYQAGLAFARETAAVAAQDALHWQVKANVSNDVDATVVELVATDAAGRPLPGLQAVARLVHPTDRRGAHVVPLHETAPGRFEGATGEVVGRWALEVELWRGGARMFRSKNRVFLR